MQRSAVGKVKKGVSERDDCIKICHWEIFWDFVVTHSFTNASISKEMCNYKTDNIPPNVTILSNYPLNCVKKCLLR